MITFREIANDTEGVRSRLKQNITNEDIDIIFDLLTNLYKKVKNLSDMEMKYRKSYQDLYRKVHNIPDDAIVEWNKLRDKTTEEVTKWH